MARGREDGTSGKSEILGHTYINGVLTGTNYVLGTSSRKICIDEVHPGPPYIQVGPLYIAKDVYTRHNGVSHSLKGLSGRKYVGGFHVPSPGIQNGSATLESLVPSYDAVMASLEGLGATGWNRAKPGSPGVGLGQALVEGRRIPRVPGASAASSNPALKRFLLLKALKGAGDEYLNLTFGWQPFLSDLRNFAKQQRSMARALAQLKRDNNRWVKRTASIPVAPDSGWTTNTTSWAYLPHPILWSECYGTWPAVRSNGFTRTEKAWFTAKFKYYIPDIGGGNPDKQWTDRAKLALFGLNPSPSLLYEVLPWSWLIDWFTNVGDVISNMSTNAAENLVASGACVMHSSEETRFNHDIGFSGDHNSNHTQAVIGNFTRTTSMKTRAPATPFGFGLKSADLTDKQTTILSALGLARNW